MSMPTVPISRMQVSQGTCFLLLSAICGFKIIVGGGKADLMLGFFWCWDGGTAGSALFQHHSLSLLCVSVQC